MNGEHHCPVGASAEPHHRRREFLQVVEEHGGPFIVEVGIADCEVPNLSTGPALPSPLTLDDRLRGGKAPMRIEQRCDRLVTRESLKSENGYNLAFKPAPVLLLWPTLRKQ